MFKEISAAEFEKNTKVFSLFDKDWTLITAGDDKNINTMTASWGGLGILWNKNVATVYVRPSRYTLKFIDNQSRFTLSFFGGERRRELSLLGSKSGRDGDKIREAGLTPVFMDDAPAFEEAETVLICRKIYRQQMNVNCILDKAIVADSYPDGGIHVLFIGEIEKVYVKGPEIG